MQKTLRFILVCLLLTYFQPAFSQDEGLVVKKGEIAKPKSIFFSLGPSFRSINNTSDYSGGFGLELGFLKRLNRNLSVGPSISYTKFHYDESISDSFSNTDAEGNNIFYEPGGYEIHVTHLSGGNLSLLTAGYNIRFNFIPISELKKFSVYGFAKPFLLLASREAVTGTYDIYYADTLPPGDPSGWSISTENNPANSPDWAADSEFTIGLNLGAGAEYRLPSGLEFFFQIAMGSTLPITSVRTDEFSDKLIDSGSGLEVDPAYPLVKKGFASIAFSLGLAYNF